MLMMLPFEAPTIFEGIHKSYFRMPRVVKDQRGKFENDDLFRQLSHEGAVKYTGFKDRPMEERQMKFIANCQEGHTEVSVVQSGNQFTLMFNPTANPAYNNEGCDFDKELGKVHIKAGFILNGVCVLWRGWIDLQRLEGFGCLEFDEYRAYIEEAMLKQQIDKQTACNNNSANNLNHSTSNSNNTTSNHLHHPLNNHHLGQTSPLGRLGAAATHPHLAAGAPPPHLAAAAAAAAAMQPPPPGVLGPAAPPSAGGPPPPHSVSGLATPVSLADSAAHYGNAAIAAAAAAAFHQALGVGGPPGPQGLHSLGGQSSAIAAAAAVAAGAPLHLHQSYANGVTSNGIPPQPQQSMSIPTTLESVFGHQPQHHPHQHHGQQQQQQQQRPLSHSNSQNSNSNTSTPNTATNRSPEHEVSSATNQTATPTISTRQPTKRAAADDTPQTQVDDVDVVSDISSHDLDFPPRRLFKSSSMSAGHHHHNSHHSHHHHHHRATRRA